MRNARHCLWLAGVLFASQEWLAAAQSIVLHQGRSHLRSGAVPEWTEFRASTPAGRSLELRFIANSNTTAATLFIQQDDVRQDWRVELNRRRLGNLFLMEADLVHSLPVPAGTLRNGTNILSIVPPSDNDDIVLRDIRLDSRPLTNALREAVIEARVTDAETSAGLPCRLTVINAQGALAAVMNLGNTAPLVALRPGVAYTPDGQARLGLLAGDYTVFASRGLEWTTATQHVHIASGAVARVELALQRAVPTPGWVSCDTHVHTFTHSRHGDATIEERMVTLAGEGIEVPIATDHNLHIDFTDAARRVGVAAHFTPVVGNEVTTAAGHFNLFPVEPSARVPDPLLTDWPRLMAAMRATPQVQVVVLNHPRNVHNHFQPFAATNFNAVTGENRRGPEFTFDAMEVMNSSAQQSDYLLVYRDWFALLNHGYRITAVGSSDGHDVSRYIVGQGRTYIAAPDTSPDRIDVSGLCRQLKAGRALVSMGLIADLTVNERFRVGDLATNLGAEVRVTARVLAPPWIQATNVSLFANGLIVREQPLTGTTNQTIDWTLPRPIHDTHLVAIATGPGVTAPYWAIPRPYQPTSPDWTSRVIGSTNPIWVDADGDGQFSAARAYARRLVAESGGDPSKLIRALDRYDEAVAIQAAGLSAAGGRSLEAPELAAALRSVGGQVQRGIDAFARSRPR